MTPPRADRRPGRACALIAAAAAAGALVGCGIPNPGAPTTPGSTPTGLGTPATAVADQRDPRVRVAVDYALTQATWSPDTWLRQKAHLARLAVGAARAQLATPDGQAPADVARWLKAAGASSRAALIGTDGPTADDRVVVAYKTTATGAGHIPRRATYALAHLTLTRHQGRWLVARFEVQP